MRPLTNVERALAAREAGNVRRCHTLPHVGEYTVGKHSFDAVSLLLILHPAPSVSLIMALMWHDCGERWTGDIPSPAKHRDQVFHDALDAMELGQIQEWEFYEGFEGLEGDDYAWLRAIDQIEFCLWCHDQEAFGNKHVLKARGYTEKLMNSEAHRWPAPCLEFYAAFKWDRMPENVNEL